MAITFGNVENTDFVYTETASAAASLTANVPSVAAGELILCFCYSKQTTATINTPSGYTTTFGAADASGFVNCFWKIAAGGETTISLVLSTGTSNIQAIVCKLTGHDATTPINITAVASASGGSNWNSPTITTTVNGCLLFFGGGATGTSDWLSGDEPDTTTLVKQDTTSDTWMGLAIESQTTAAATGTRLWTNASNGKRAFSLAVAPSTSTAADITSVTGPGSVANLIRQGESSTIAGTGFEASQSTGNTDLDGTSLTETAWSDTSITITGPSSGEMFGASKTLTVTPATNTPDSIAGQTYSPPTGQSYITFDAAGITGMSTASIGYGITGLAANDQARFETTATMVGAPSNTATVVVAEGSGNFYLTGVTVPGDYEFPAWFRDASDATDSGESVITFDATLPTVASVTIDATGLVLTLTLSENAAVGTGGATGLTLIGQYGTITAAYDSTSTANVIYDLSRTAYDNEVLTLSYVQPGLGITDTIGNELASFTGLAITNNSTEVYPVVYRTFAEWIYNQPGLTGTVNDRLKAFLVGLGYSGTNGDMLFKWLTDTGYTQGTLPDKLYAWSLVNLAA